MMRTYVIKRLAQGVVALFVLVSLVFVLARLIGSPVDMMLPPQATAAEREFMIHQLGLDRPLHVQYGEYMWGLLRGDVGDSISFGKPVMRLFLDRFPNTLSLAMVALSIALVTGLALGLASGTHQGALVDRVCRAVSVIGMSAPDFWVGLMLMLVFAYRLRLLPIARMGGPSSYILPGFTWSLVILAGTARLVRSSMIEVLDGEFVKLALIKGASRSTVIWKHCLRNALLPVASFVGVQLTFLLNGSVMIESVFAWPGVGRLIYQGIVQRDYPLVQGCILIVGSMAIALNLAVDVLYSYIDPRIRLARGHE